MDSSPSGAVTVSHRVITLIINNSHCLLCTRGCWERLSSQSLSKWGVLKASRWELRHMSEGLAQGYLASHPVWKVSRMCLRLSRMLYTSDVPRWRRVSLMAGCWSVVLPSKSLCPQVFLVQRERVWLKSGIATKLVFFTFGAVVVMVAVGRRVCSIRWLRLTLNWISSCLSLPSAASTGAGRASDLSPDAPDLCLLFYGPKMALKSYVV